jgi:hypothetical protein
VETIISMDLANCFLYVRAKITRVNNDDLHAANMVGLVNDFSIVCFAKGTCCLTARI